MLKAYKYRIYPTIEQRIKIDRTIGVCRLIYNLALQCKIWAYQGGVKLSVYDLELQISGLKKDYKWIDEVNGEAIRSALKNIDCAFINFFKGGGFPKFKSKKNRVQSFVCRNNTRKIDWENSTLTITKIINIPIVLSRKFEGEIRRITISKTSTNKYYASVLVKTIDNNPPFAIPSNAVGIDLGISTFATLSTGEKIDNSRHLKSSLQRLKTLQHRASRKKKGSNNRKKANKKVALLHEKITNQRQDMLHKVSTRLIRDNQTDTICVETLAVKNMVKNHKLAQAISDVSWSEFVRQLEYKGNWYGKNIMKVDRFYASSKTCSNCGHKLDELDLSIREWTCSNCNVTHDRDVNAAINIRNSGMGSPVEPVELSAIAGAVKQELYKCQIKEE